MNTSIIDFYLCKDFPQKMQKNIMYEMIDIFTYLHGKCKQFFTVCVCMCVYGCVCVFVSVGVCLWVCVIRLFFIKS